MIRTHSIRVACHEIIGMAEFLDLVKINIVGNQSTGKSTLAATIAHIIHKESKIPFAVRTFHKEELLNFRETIIGLKPTNYILIFDDISFLSANASSKKLTEISQAFTEIRHLPGHTDVKMIIIFNFHYTMAVSKYLRQSDAHFYTTVGTSDTDNVLKLIGHKFASKLIDFQRISKQTKIKPYKYTFKLGNKGRTFEYQYRQPFAPAFYFNGNSARFVVFPHRNWIDKICPTCSLSDKESTQTATNSISDFDKAIQTKFGKTKIKQAIRLKLYIHGISTYDKRIVNALKFIDKWTAKNSISLEDLADYYELKEERTALRVDPTIFEPKTA